MGDQHFYTLRGKIDDEETAVTTGLCDVARDGSELVVNGEPMHVRGVNLLTDSPEDVDRAIECNANLIRGHAQALPESVYERCDEAGMLVWQDLPLTGPGSFDTERGETLAAALGNQYGRHPSLAVVGIHDDPIDAFEDGLGSGLLDRMRLRYRAWRSNYDDQPARTLADAVTVDRPVIPVVGGPGVGADAGSYYPGWQYGHADTIDDLLDRYPVDIVAEFGAGALADTQGMQADEAAGFDASIHDRRVGGDVAASQAYQAEVIETVAGSLRRERVGAIALAIRDTDEAGMGVYGHDGTQKAGAETLASAYAPIRASVTDPAADESDIVVLNDRPRPLSTDITYIAGDEQGSFELTVNAQGRWRGGPITLPEDAEQVEIEIDLDGDTLAFEEEL
jgi:beta-mannosidase